MSTWSCKLDGNDVGPLSFAELAELVREGKVTEGVPVCRGGTMNWEPAWHVPGLFRAAGIVEPGDSPLVERQGEGETEGQREGETEGRREGGRERQREGAAAKGPLLTFADVVRGAIGAAAGLLAVGFFYRWAQQATMAFPVRPQEVDGEIVDCFFPLLGRCTSFECGLLYVDVFAIAAMATWHAVGSRVMLESRK